MNIYYFANAVYQYGHSKSIYDITGGTFIVNKFHRMLRFKYYLFNSLKNKDQRGALGSPKVIIRDLDQYLDLRGIIISGSNTIVNNNKKISYSIFMGHGTGDKKYGGSAKTLETYDYHFISGPKHLHKLKDVDVKINKKRMIKIGYPKFDDYVNKKIDDVAYMDYLGIKDKSRKNILYAPTWEWGNGTLEKFGKKFCLELNDNYNLILRPHFNDRKHLIPLKVWAKAKGLKNIYFSNPAKILKNNTMLDFSISDMMISDTSSIIYEYLITGNPIIIADNNYGDLHSMPEELNILEVAEKYDGGDICKAVEFALSDDSSANYLNLLNNCFYFNDGKSSKRAADFISSLKIKNM
tara:strand:+ start:168 stop:1223 length:1056 start_codon:yes stop_codon:yes gene_type:complete